MDRNEIKKKIMEFQDKIGMWRIIINNLSEADFVLGYGFDDISKKWKVYQNNEQENQLEWYFETEDEALLKLYKKVKFQYKISN